jgi:hypothetical protein
MPRRVALTIDADDGRLTNVRKSIDRIHALVPRWIDADRFLWAEICFSSRDTASVAPTEPIALRR